MRFDQRTGQFAQGNVGFSGHDLDQKQHMRRKLACGAGGAMLPLSRNADASLTAVLGLTPNTRAAVRQECPAAMWSNTRCRKSIEYALPMRHPLSEVNHTSRPMGIPRDSGQTQTA